MKKECPTSKLISPFMDKELPPAKMKEVENHLNTCSKCREEMKLLSAAEHLLTGLPEIEPSNDFDRSFQQKLSRLEEKKLWDFSTFFTFKRQPYFAVAMTLLIVAGLAVFYQGRNTAPPETEDIIISENLELLENYETIDNLDLLENWEAIMMLEKAS